MSWTCIVCKKETVGSNEVDLLFHAHDFDYSFCNECGDVFDEKFKEFLISLVDK